MSVTVHRWTSEELERAADAGVFAPDVRLELIQGELVEQMSPQNSPHTTAMHLTAYALDGLFRDGYYRRMQSPLAVSAQDRPEPDIAIVEGAVRDFEDAHPPTAALVVEVSDSTLAYDRDEKAALYARAGVPEYWIVNLPNRLLEVHRDPLPVSGAPGGYQYRSIVRLGEAAAVSPLAFPEAVVPVSDLLPRARRRV